MSTMSSYPAVAVAADPGPTELRAGNVRRSVTKLALEYADAYATAYAWLSEPTYVGLYPLWLLREATAWLWRMALEVSLLTPCQWRWKAAVEAASWRDEEC